MTSRVLLNEKVRKGFAVYELLSSEFNKQDWDSVGLFKSVGDAQAALRLYVPERVISIGWTLHRVGDEVRYHTYVDSRHWSIEERVIYETTGTFEMPAHIREILGG